MYKKITNLMDITYTYSYQRQIDNKDKTIVFNAKSGRCDISATSQSQFHTCITNKDSLISRVKFLTAEEDVSTAPYVLWCVRCQKPTFDNQNYRIMLVN